MFGGKGNDTLMELEGDDQLFGNLGEDNISGGEGNDTIYGGQGGDTVIGLLGNDFVSGDKGIDVLIGVDFTTIALGFGEIDTLAGGEGRDTFFLVSTQAISFYLGLGDSDFALFTDFNPAEDFIVVSPTDAITFTDFDFGEFGIGVGIFSQENDLIAFIQGVNASQLGFDVNVFRR